MRNFTLSEICARANHMYGVFAPKDRGEMTSKKYKKSTSFAGMTLQKAHASRCIKIHKAAHLRARSTLKYVCKRIINPLLVYGSKSSFSVGASVWVCSLTTASNFLLSLKDSVKLNKNSKFLGNASCICHAQCSKVESFPTVIISGRKT